MSPVGSQVSVKVEEWDRRRRSEQKTRTEARSEWRHVRRAWHTFASFFFFLIFAQISSVFQCHILRSEWETTAGHANTSYSKAGKWKAFQTDSSHKPLGGKKEEEEKENAIKYDIFMLGFVFSYFSIFGSTSKVLEPLLALKMVERSQKPRTAGNLWELEKA